MEHYYKIGHFAKMMNVSIRTIRYYDQIGLLKPSKTMSNGYRLYDQKDILKLQKILSLKYMGFSLEDIFSMTVNEDIPLKKSLSMQQRMIQHKIQNLEHIKNSLEKVQNYLEMNQTIDWSEMFKQVELTTKEGELINQYRNSNNIDIRIGLHERYSTNPCRWFKWLFSQYHLKEGMRVLEIGCGNGELWAKNKDQMPGMDLILSDISINMVENTQENLKDFNHLQFDCFDAQKIPYDDQSFDIVIANHVLFYVENIQAVLKEVKRVLKNEGIFYCSTYSGKHMKEITDLVQDYHPKINLSENQLYEVFGLHNGYEILHSFFAQIELKKHEDALFVDRIDDLIGYILSCKGNQNSYILSDFNRFHDYVDKRVGKGIKITKDAGIFICQK